MRVLAFAILAAATVLAPVMLSAQSPFRGPVPFTEVPPAPPMPAEVTDERRVTRNYPEQPPVIPHAIRDYQVDLNVNRCLTCHARQFTEAVQAPMISITHYIDRDGQVLGAVAPRRYFCLQCHVPQTDAPPLVENTFQDVDILIQPSPGGGGAVR